MSAAAVVFFFFFLPFFQVHKCLCETSVFCLVRKSLDVNPKTAAAPPTLGSLNAASVNIIIIIYPSGEEPTGSFFGTGRKGGKKKKLEDDWTSGRTGQIHHGQFSLIATSRSVLAVLTFFLYPLPLMQ